MSANLFEDYQSKRVKLKDFAQSALNQHWIKEEDFKGIVESLNNDVLTIGVIGQMKCGKSTFLNAFLFGDEVLPAATTPMTAALSIITYGEKKEVEVEFYSPDEWEEQKTNASRNIEDVKEDPALLSKIKAAKEMVDNSKRLGSELNSLLGTTKSDELNKLQEYVGADGRYVSITKSVTIHYPEEWLKGVQIVDTPGFNDPVASREERTNDFLKKADVVILLLYAGRAFDETDKAILFDKVANVGVGKILVGVNKYDLNFHNGEKTSEMKTNVLNAIRKACSEKDGSLVADQLKDVSPILFSASMALMAKMPMSKISSDETWKFHWNQSCSDFGISDQKSMLEKSLIGDLESSVRELIKNSKEDILIKKTTNIVLQAGKNILEDLRIKSLNVKECINNYSKPDDELEEKIYNLGKVQRKLKHSIDDLLGEMDTVFDDNVEKTVEKLWDLSEFTENSIFKEIDNASSFSFLDGLDHTISRKINKMQREISRETEMLLKNLSSGLEEKAINFCDEIEDIVNKYMPDDPDDLIYTLKSMVKGYKFSIPESNDNSEKSNDNEADESWVVDILEGMLIVPFAIEFFSQKDDYRDAVNKYFRGLDFDALKKIMKPQKEIYRDSLHGDAVLALLNKLNKIAEEAKNNKEGKEQKLLEAQTELKQVDSDMAVVKKQLEEMNKQLIEIG
jgi:predicted GTPase/GTP-binding protein EngB required for normal cell division